MQSRDRKRLLRMDHLQLTLYVQSQEPLNSLLNHSRALSLRFPYIATLAMKQRSGPNWPPINIWFRKLD